MLIQGRGQCGPDFAQQPPLALDRGEIIGGSPVVPQETADMSQVFGHESDRARVWEHFWWDVRDFC